MGSCHDVYSGVPESYTHDHAPELKVYDFKAICCS